MVNCWRVAMAALLKMSDARFGMSLGVGTYLCTAANRVSRAASSARSFSPHGLLCLSFLVSCLSLRVFKVPLTKLKRIPANQNLAATLAIL